MKSPKTVTVLRSTMRPLTAITNWSRCTLQCGGICAGTSVCASEQFTVFFILCICLPHKALETGEWSICESNVQKEKVAAAAAPAESDRSLCLSASLWGGDYTLNLRTSRQEMKTTRNRRDKRTKGAFQTRAPGFGVTCLSTAQRLRGAFLHY